MIHEAHILSNRLEFSPSRNEYTVRGNIWFEIRKEEDDMWGIYDTGEDKLVFGSNDIESLKSIILLMT